MQELISKFGLLLFGYYLILIPNFIKETAGCQLTRLLDSNIIAKHLAGLILLFSLVIIISPDYSEKTLLSNIGIALLAYVWLLLTSKSDLRFTLLTILLLLITYVANNVKTKYEKAEDVNNVDKAIKVRNISAILALVATLVGVVMYYSKNKKRIGSLYKYIIGTAVCNIN